MNAQNGIASAVNRSKGWSSEGPISLTVLGGSWSRAAGHAPTPRSSKASLNRKADA